MILPSFLILIFTIAPKSAFTQTILSKNTQVTPRCGSQLISIEINFDSSQLPDGKFTDWIIVGVSGRPECRLKGNGETKYVIEIAVFNDPCLTQIPAQNVFQNRVRIGKNPIVILEEDQSMTVKCVYGLPTVESVALPVINSNFNIDNNNHVDSLLPQSVPAQVSNLANQADLNTDSNAKVSLVDSFSVPVESREGLEKQSGASLLPAKFSQLENSHPTTLKHDDSEQWAATFSPSQFGHSLEFPPSKEKSQTFSTFFLGGAVFVLTLLLLFIFILVLCLRKNFNSPNRHLLVTEVSDSNKNQPESLRQTWQKSSSNENYDIASLNNEKDVIRIARPAGIGPNYFLTDKDKLHTRRNPSLKFHRKKQATPQPDLPLKSNLEEFVSKTYAFGDFKRSTNPAYVLTSEYEEREVDAGSGIKPKSESQKESASEKFNHNEENAISSYRSITEIVHAAETANFSQGSTIKESSTILEALSDCVYSVRGYGYKKLTEQEIIRWKNLIQQDSQLQSLLMTAKSLAEIENIFELEEYKNMFTSSKWHEIASCIHRTMTNSLDRSNSRSELQLFVGNVQTDW